MRRSKTFFPPAVGGSNSSRACRLTGKFRSRDCVLCPRTPASLGRASDNRPFMCAHASLYAPSSGAAPSKTNRRVALSAMNRNEARHFCDTERSRLRPAGGLIAARARCYRRRSATREGRLASIAALTWPLSRRSLTDFAASPPGFIQPLRSAIRPLIAFATRVFSLTSILEIPPAA